MEVEVVNSTADDCVNEEEWLPPEICEVGGVDSSDNPVGRQQKLLNMVEDPDSGFLDDVQRKCLHQFLAAHRDAFALDPGERGETKWRSIQGKQLQRSST